jgi:hypothetical protein
MLVLCVAALLMAGERLTFPPMKASNLNGEQLQLPGAFQGKLTLALIAFQREQQKNVDTWLAQLPKIRQAHPELAYYELPTISRLNPLTRWIIDTGMRGGIPDKQQRARTITLYIDKKPFRDALQLPSEDTIYALLLNKAGEVVWRAEGDYNDASGKSLEQFLSTR